MTETFVQIQLLQIKEELNAFLAWLAPRAPVHIVEIGAHQGGTALHFCQVASGLTISVDLPEGEGGGLTWAQCGIRNQMITSQFARYRSVLGDSHDPATLGAVVRLLKGEPADLLFIDGDHTLPGVTADYAMYAPLVRPGGAVAFHDINDTAMHRAVGCVVSEFWATLPGTKREFNVHGAWGGIGVVEV